jgi:hypothetical protein
MLKWVKSTGLLVPLVFAVCTASLSQEAAISPRDQFQQYVTLLQANPSDDALRTKVIQLGQQLEPPPKIPPEADELDGRAHYMFEHANSPDDLVKAAEAYEKVALIVPWLPDYYLDAAIAYEKADHPAEALRNYKFSVLGYPTDSQDARKLRGKIGALTFVVEQQQEKAAAEQARAEQARRDADAEAARQRELAAEQERQAELQREQQAAEERARLARLDPTVRSLDGTRYVQDGRDNDSSPPGRLLRTYTISGDRVLEHQERFIGGQSTGTYDYVYLIEGNRFVHAQYQTCEGTSDGCQLVGIISDKEISWSWWDGNRFLRNFRDPWGGNAKRVR